MARQHFSYRHRRPRRSNRARGSRAAFVRTLLLLWAAVAMATWAAMPRLAGLSTALISTPTERLATEQSAYYPNCAAARIAGAAPIHQGQPGYRDALDADSDGIACEPYR